MSAVLKDSFISIEDYLAGELVSEIKHEYIDGYVYAMAGASVNHGRIAGNVSGELRQHLKKLPCDVLTSDLKVNVGTKFFYPDVVVICNHENGEDYYTQSPLLIVEVLSKSTRCKDKKLKLLAYQSLPSVQEYVLIEQNVVDITVYRRSENWFPQSYFLGDDVTFESVDFTMSVEEIYRRVDNEDICDFLSANPSS